MDRDQGAVRNELEKAIISLSHCDVLVLHRFQLPVELTEYRVVQSDQDSFSEVRQKPILKRFHFDELHIAPNDSEGGRPPSRCAGRFAISAENACLLGMKSRIVYRPKKKPKPEKPAPKPAPKATIVKTRLPRGPVGLTAYWNPPKDHD